MALFYAGNFAEPLEFGHIIVITGTTTPNANRFDVNLARGKKPEDHIGLHLSCRFAENFIVRNSYDGEWGDENRRENLDDNADQMPIKRGDEFQIYIFVGDYGFNVAINGDPYCTFEHRLTVEDIRSITLYYDVQTLRAIDQRRAYPQPHPVIQCDDNTTTFSHDMPFAPYAGHVIVISAMPFGNPGGRFEMQFNQGSNTDKEALHLSARFGEGCIVRNNRDDNGDWGDEERHGPFPLMPNQLFRMAIAFGETFFRIAINGNYFCDFIYRTDDVLEDLNGFTICCEDGLDLIVRGVDHMKVNSPTCDGFHLFSNLFDPLISNV